MQRKNNPVYFIDSDYKVDYTKGNALVRDNYTLATGSTFFDSAYARWKAEGRTDDKFLDLYQFEAAYWDALWKSHAGDMTSTCQSRSTVYIPAGYFKVSTPLTVAFGQYIGQGTSAFYTNGNSPWTGNIPQGGTEIHIDVAKWQYNPKDRNIFQSNTWGREDLYSYNESFFIDAMRLVGDKASENYDSTIQSSGLGLWDAGSTSKVGRLFLENWNTAGINNQRGTPLTVDEITTFRNNLAGVLLGAGGMHSFNMVEADENPTVFLVKADHGRVGATTLDVKYVKSETGKAPGRDYGKGQMILDTDNTPCWVNAHFSTINYAAVVDFPECAFRVNAGTNTSSLKVTNWVLFGPCHSLFHDVQNNKKWMVDGQLNSNGYWGSRIHGFKWESSGGGNLVTDFGTATMVTGVAKNRLAVSPVDPMTGKPTLTWNEQAGTPTYQWGAGGSNPVPQAPVINSFTCTPATLSAAGEVTLNWSTTNATTCSINGTAVSPTSSGTTKMNVSSSTTFTLTASNTNGSVTSTASVTVSAAPTTAYNISFSGKSPTALPGCKPSQVWESPAIVGAVATLAGNTNVVFTAPQTAIKQMVLKNVVGSGIADYKYLNDQVRVVGMNFVLASNTNLVLAPVPTTKKNVTLTFPLPVTITNLLGFAYNSAPLSMEGLELIRS